MMKNKILFTNGSDVVLSDHEGVVLVPLTVPKDNPAALLKAFNLKCLNLPEIGRFQCPLEISPLYRQFFLLQQKYKENIASWIASLPDNKEKILNILGEMTTNVDDIGTLLTNMGKSPQLPIETQIIKQQGDLIRLGEEAIKHVVMAIQNQFKENPLVCNIVMENSNSAMNTAVINLFVNLTEDMVQYLIIQLQDRITENLLIVAMNFSRKFELAELINASDFDDESPATVITGAPAQMLVDEKLERLQAVSVPKAESDNNKNSCSEAQILDLLHTLWPDYFEEDEDFEDFEDLKEEWAFRVKIKTDSQLGWQDKAEYFLSFAEELVHFDLPEEQTEKVIEFLSLESKLCILQYSLKEYSDDDIISSDLRDKLLDVQKTLNTAPPFYRNWLNAAGIQQILDTSDAADYALKIAAETEQKVREVQKKIYVTMDREERKKVKKFFDQKEIEVVL